LAPMRADDAASAQLAAGLAGIRAQYGVPASFPPEVLKAAEQAAARPITLDGGRRDARDLPMATLDPASSIDLDQAFALAAEGDTLVLSYAIADVGFFVDRGGIIEAEAFKRGSTVYLPDGRTPQYPPILCENAASLLPDVDRPAILLTTLVAPDGTATLRKAERAVIRSRAKLAYETATEADFGSLLPELFGRIHAAEERRGANRVDFPEQEVTHDPSAPGGLLLVCRERAESEDQNSGMSLAANMAVAQRMAAAHTGLFRTMEEPNQGAIGALHHAARALGIAWPKGASLKQVQTGLDSKNPKHVAFLLQIRRAGGRAIYTPFAEGHTPWHAAIAATYAHATAPLRRLADRYVLDLVVSLDAGQLPTANELATLAALPPIMEKASEIDHKVDRASIDLVEAVTMAGRVGEVFDAVVTDTEGSAARIQLVDPPVWAKVPDCHRSPGDNIRVRLVDSDPALHQVHFALAD
jgi:exoribonuclease R